MLLLVYVRTELSEHVTNVSVNTVATGILGMLGNKGGVGITLRLHATELCFVCRCVIHNLNLRDIREYTNCLHVNMWLKWNHSR